MHGICYPLVSVRQNENYPSDSVDRRYLQLKCIGVSTWTPNGMLLKYAVHSLHVNYLEAHTHMDQPEHVKKYNRCRLTDVHICAHNHSHNTSSRCGHMDEGHRYIRSDVRRSVMAAFILRFDSSHATTID